ncbi:MAG: ankyrin repeat domain-containing protein [Candidatus Babeliales bacterium]
MEIISELFDAILTNNIEKVKELLQTKNKLYENEFLDTYLETPLMLASRKKHIEVVKLLLENGANAANEHGKTALTNAIFWGHKEIVKLLLENGALIDDNDMFVPITLQEKDVLEVCLKNCTTHAKNKALWSSVLLDYKDGAELSLKHGADINALHEDVKNGDTPFIAAVRCRRINIIELLIQYGADQSIKNNKGKTALDLAKTKKIKNILLKQKDGDA